MKVLPVLLFLLSLSTEISFAKGLQEEARNYRKEGYLLHKGGNIDLAVSFYQKAAVLYPEYATVHNDLGIAYEEKGWLQRAEQEYKKALSIDPEYGPAYFNLAALYERMGKRDLAQFYWKKRANLGADIDIWKERAKKRLKALTTYPEE